MSEPTHSALSHSALKDLREYWFAGCPQTNDAPPEAAGMVMKRWFSGDKEVDRHCRSRFSDLLQSTEPLSISSLHSFALSSDSPHESALGLMILLDQMPRNIFRGPETRRVHEEFDPKALALSKMFIASPDKFDDRRKWTNFHYRSFFFLPLMHSEQLSDHDVARHKLQQSYNEAESENEKAVVTRMTEFEEKHRAVIEKFGRYPSRNDCLGRKSTNEEKEFTRDGPGW